MGSKTKKESGTLGESLAADYLKKNGYKIIERNYYTKLGEIDIIAKDKDCLCFVEVKTRTNDNKGLPEEAVSRAKIRKISQNVLTYLKQKRINDCDMRFDVVGVIFDNQAQEFQINLIKDAFALDKRYFY